LPIAVLLSALECDLAAMAPRSWLCSQVAVRAVRHAWCGAGGC